LEWLIFVRGGKHIAILVKKDRYTYLVKLPAITPETIDKAYEKLGEMTKFYVGKGKIHLVDIETGKSE